MAVMAAWLVAAAAGSGGVEVQKPVAAPVKAGATFQREAGGGGTGWLAFLFVEADGGGSDPDAHLDRRGPALFARGRGAGEEPQVMQDASFGMEVELYEGEAVFTLPVRVAAGAASGRRNWW